MTITQQHIIKFSKGDKTAFKHIYNAMFQPLCFYGLKIISDTDIVSGIVQDVFVEIWQRRNQFDNLLKFRTYLYVSVRNKLLTEKKRLKPDLSPNENDCENLGYHQNLMEEETYRMLYHAINQLPRQTKKIIQLTLKGYGVKEVATALNISVNTVKTLKKSGYEKLRISLKNNILILSILTDIF